MKTAIGMVELSSIARGIDTTDAMVKAAQVNLVRSSTICPGKYVILVSGDTGDVRASMRAGIANGGSYVVDTLMISNIHEQLLPALTGTNPVGEPQALGVIEFYSVASAILAADEAAKAAQIRLIEVRTGFAIGGKGFVTLTGDVGDVRAAVKAASEVSEFYVGNTVIPHPSPLTVKSLM